MDDMEDLLCKRIKIYCDNKKENSALQNSLIAMEKPCWDTCASWHGAYLPLNPAGV